jgi:hypothetical protein
MFTEISFFHAVKSIGSYYFCTFNVAEKTCREAFSEVLSSVKLSIRLPVIPHCRPSSLQPLDLYCCGLKLIRPDCLMTS